VSTVHVVKQGEWLQKIARAYGFSSWRTLYDDPANEALRAKRPNPDLLYPGDEVVIPDKARKDTLQTDAPYRVVLGRRASDSARFRPRLADGTALAGRDYELKLGSTMYKGQIPASGVVEHPLAADAVKAELKVALSDGNSITWLLDLGHLDPLETLTGLQTRLRNLGYYYGPLATADGDPDPATQAAIRQFQKDHGLAIDGKATPETRAKLLEAYGV
jgi:hypothetical protein